MSDESGYSPRKLGCVGWAAVAFLGVICLALSLFGLLVSKREIAQSISPDGKLIAETYEIDGGATTEFLYTVQLSRNWPLRWSYQAAYLYGATTGPCNPGIKVRWVGNDTISIAYFKAKEIDLERDVNVTGRHVAIKSHANVTDGSVCPPPIL